MKLLISVNLVVYHHSSVVKHWCCDPQILSSNPPKTCIESYWNNFLKVLFSPKSLISFAFWTFIYQLYASSFFIIKSFWVDKLYPAVLSHLNTLKIKSVEYWSPTNAFDMDVYTYIYMHGLSWWVVTLAPYFALSPMFV